jgi:hypothetical protein
MAPRAAGALIAAALALGALPAGGSALGAASICDAVLVSSEAGPVRDPALREISGIDAGIASPGVWWVHNDSGDSARLFAIDSRGRTLRIYSLADVTAVDWEDIAVGPGPAPGASYVYVGDIGDNGANRSEVQVLRVREPIVSRGRAVTLGGVATLRLRYPDGPRDAEALVVDPERRQLYVIEKRRDGRPAGIYRAPAGLPDGSRTTLRRVGALRLGAGLGNAVTAADVSTDGSRLAVRTYGTVLLWQRPRGRTIPQALTGPRCVGPIPFELQGEAIAFRPDGRGYATIAEGAGQTLHLVAVRGG